MNPAEPPILIVDSGLGGLATLAALRTRLPAARLVYLADTLGGPYGNKSPAAVADRVGRLVARGAAWRPRHVLVACHTAAALALPDIRRCWPQFSFSGPIEPAARAAAAAAGKHRRPRFGVLTTTATFRSRAYHTALGTRRPRAKVLLRATPLLVPLVEERRDADDSLVRAVVADYLRPLLERGIDVLVPGCGHLDGLRRAFEAECGPGVAVVDTAGACADDVAHRIGDGACAAGRGRTTIHVTDDPARFARLARRLCPMALPEPALLELDHDVGREAGPTLRAAG